MRRASLIALTAFVGLAVFGVWGARTGSVEASGEGSTLAVRYPSVTRGGLAIAFEIEVRRSGGFDRPVTIAVDRDWLSLFDENGLDPDPVSATADAEGGVVLWSFEPPRSDALVVSFDARTEPGAQWGKPGSVALLDEGGRAVLAVQFRTRVMP